MLIESLTHIGNAQASLASIQLALMEDQENAVRLDQIARIAQGLESNAKALRETLTQWATDVRLETAADNAMAAEPLTAGDIAG